MRLYLDMTFHPGTKANPRPSLRLTARAHRQDKAWLEESFVHTRLVDEPYPENIHQAMHAGLKRLQELRDQRSPLFFSVFDVDPSRTAEIMVG